MALKADVIVVGAGSAGSIVARRLVDAGYDVVLAEAGDEDTNPAIHDVMRLAELWMSPQDWGYHTVAQKNAASRLLHLPRGKVLGGSHALNAAIWVRGRVEDFEHWQRLGAPQWGWDDVSAVYDRIEAYDGPATKDVASPDRWTSPSPGMSTPSSSRSSTPRSRPAWSSTPTTTAVGWTASPRCSSPSGG